jgi:phosphotransferase system HPr (HPr) family protein
MLKAKIRIKDPLGVHARPASEIVDACKHIDSKVTIIKGKQAANGKSILELILLNASFGAEVEIIAEGKDEELALRRLIAIFEPAIQYSNVA